MILPKLCHYIEPTRSCHKAIIEVTVKLIVNMDEGVKTYDVVNELQYDFTSGMLEAEIIETEILDHEVIVIDNK